MRKRETSKKSSEKANAVDFNDLIHETKGRITDDDFS